MQTGSEIKPRAVCPRDITQQSDILTVIFELLHEMRVQQFDLLLKIHYTHRGLSIVVFFYISCVHIFVK